MNVTSGITYKGTVDIKLGKSKFRCYNSGTAALSRLFSSFLAGYTISKRMLPAVACIAGFTHDVAIESKVEDNALKVTFNLPSTSCTASVDTNQNKVLQLKDSNETTLAETSISPDIANKLRRGRTLLITWKLELINGSEDAEEGGSN